MPIDAIPSLIGTLGFPIVITLYLLLKFDKTISDLVAQIARLVDQCQRCQETYIELLRK